MGSCWKRLTHSEVKSKRSKMPIVKFVYFDAQAKGELARLLLAAGNIDYEDFRVGFNDWPGEIKASTPFGQMPVLYWDGEEIAQSMAIARFVARKVGLAGNSDLEFCQADMIACHYEDIWTKLPKMKFAKTQEEREELAKEMNNLADRKKILDDFPLVKANYQATCELPFVVEWKKKRPAFQGF